MEVSSGAQKSRESWQKFRRVTYREACPTAEAANFGCGPGSMIFSEVTTLIALISDESEVFQLKLMGWLLAKGKENFPCCAGLACARRLSNPATGPGKNFSSQLCTQSSERVVFLMRFRFVFRPLSFSRFLPSTIILPNNF